MRFLQKRLKLISSCCLSAKRAVSYAMPSLLLAKTTMSWICLFLWRRFVRLGRICLLSFTQLFMHAFDDVRESVNSIQERLRFTRSSLKAFFLRMLISKHEFAAEALRVLDRGTSAMRRIRRQSVRSNALSHHILFANCASLARSRIRDWIQLRCGDCTNSS